MGAELRPLRRSSRLAVALLLALPSLALAAGAARKEKAPPPEAAKKELAGEKPPAAAEEAKESKKEKEAEEVEEEAQAPAAPELFDEALVLLRAGKPREAAPRFFDFLHRSPRTADNYEPAELFLAESMVQLGFTHAAAVYYADVARTRARPETLPEALKAMERLSRGPHDEELIEREVLYGTDFGFMGPEIADYVHYNKGLMAYRDGQLRWSNFHFDKLKPNTVYAARARLLRAVDKLTRQNDVEGAQADFDALIADERAPLEVKNEARISSARLAYERRDFALAEKLYDSVQLPELDAGRGQIYLEKAWTFYERRDLSRAMGLLLALDAPSFRELFLPEKHLLRAFIYKDRCHYLPAKRAAREFTHRYRNALALIKARGDLAEDPRLLHAAYGLDGNARKADAFHKALLAERDQVDATAGRFQASGLTARLRKIYDRAVSEAARQRELAVKKATTAAADRLLREAEQVRLLDYEVGLDLYKRVKKGTLAQQLIDEEDRAFVTDQEIAYSFDGEYWNDELKDYRFQLPNRCAAEVAAQ